MSRWSYGGWLPYVPVAERRKMAAREMEKLEEEWLQLHAEIEALEQNRG